MIRAGGFVKSEADLKGETAASARNVATGGSEGKFVKPSLPPGCITVASGRGWLLDTLFFLHLLTPWVLIYMGYPVLEWVANILGFFCISPTLAPWRSTRWVVPPLATDVYRDSGQQYFALESQRAPKGLPDFSERGSLARGKGWDKIWSKLPQSEEKDWYSMDSTFVGLVKPFLRREGGAEAGVLQVGVGTSKVAEKIHTLELTSRLVNVDVSPQVIERMRRRYPTRLWPRMSFHAMDAFRLNFPVGQRFPVVIEKGGVTDIYSLDSRFLEQFLACVVYGAFVPQRGGLLLSMGLEPRAGKNGGLVGAVYNRPDLNCTVEGIQPVMQRLKLYVIRCGGVPFPSALPNSCSPQELSKGTGKQLAAGQAAMSKF